MITQVKLVERRKSDGVQIFWTDNFLTERMFVKGFKEGVVEIEPTTNCLQYFASMLAGCFHPSSNFPLVLEVIFPKEGEKVKAVEFELQGVKVLVSTKDTSEEICEKWREAYRFEVRKKQQQLEDDLKNAKDIIASMEFLLRPEISRQEFEKIVEEQGDPEFVEYVCNWAKLIQFLHGKYKKTIQEAATIATKTMEPFSYDERVVLFMMTFWKYGDEMMDCILRNTSQIIIIGAF